MTPGVGWRIVVMIYFCVNLLKKVFADPIAYTNRLNSVALVLFITHISRVQKKIKP